MYIHKTSVSRQKEIHCSPHKKFSIRKKILYFVENLFLVQIQRHISDGAHSRKAWLWLVWIEIGRLSVNRTIDIGRDICIRMEGGSRVNLWHSDNESLVN